MENPPPGRRLTGPFAAASARARRKQKANDNPRRKGQTTNRCHDSTATTPRRRKIEAKCQKFHSFCAFPSQRSPTNLIRAAAKAVPSAARMSRKRDSMAQKGEAFPSTFVKRCAALVYGGRACEFPALSPKGERVDRIPRFHQRGRAG